jgi:hypothetical protein
MTFLPACAARPVPSLVPPPPPPCCPSPELPELTPLEPAEHLGSARNLELLMDNVIALAGYIERLEAALRCWGEREERKGEEAQPWK